MHFFVALRATLYYYTSISTEYFIPSLIHCTIFATNLISICALKLTLSSYVSWEGRIVQFNIFKMGATECRESEMIQDRIFNVCPIYQKYLSYPARKNLPAHTWQAPVWFTLCFRPPPPTVYQSASPFILFSRFFPEFYT